MSSMQLAAKLSAHLAAASLVAWAGLSLQPPAVHAEEDAPARASLLKSNAATQSQTTYFANGCFWGRQKDFVEAEQRLGRGSDVTAVVGYAGGAVPSPDGRVCYYYADDPKTVYERLGHAEVVEVAVSTDPSAAEREFSLFAETYFRQFKKTPFGMMRLDPQDAGPGYRNVVGLPGGVRSPLFPLLQKANVNGMMLKEGRGNQYVDGRPTEGDEFNTVWVVDSDALPFYRAEQYHQFHDGLGKTFPKEYTKDLKRAVAEAGRISPTGCPEISY